MPPKTAHLYQALIRQPGFRQRPGQHEMVDTIQRVLSDEHLGARVACIEGPTGTGKSLAYLLGSLPTALDEERPIIIATASVALQEQLLSGDIPAVRRVIDQPFEAAVSKGRRRYVCDLALVAAGAKDPSQGDLGFDGPGDAPRESLWESPPTDAQRNQVEALVLARSRHGWNGDLDAPPLPLDPVVVQKVTTGLHSCTGRGCHHFTRCAYRLAKAETMAADVVVTNHALLLQDIALGGGIALPSLEKAVVVIDEAHHLPDNAVSAFSTTLPIGQVERLLRRAAAVISAAFHALPPTASTKDHEASTPVSVAAVRDLLEWWVGIVTHRLAMPAPGERTSLRLKDPPVTHRLAAVWPDVIERLSSDVDLVKDARKGLRHLRDALRKAATDGDMPASAAAAYLGQIGPVVDVVDRLVRLVIAWTAQDAAQTGIPIARWVESGVGPNGRAELTLSCASSHPAGLLRRLLFDKAHAVILTSATLRTLGTFDSFASRAGLGFADGTQYLAIPSPFDLERQGSLVVPAEACDPRNEGVANKAAADAIVRLHARDAGTLVLFTSRRQLDAVEAALPAAIAAITQTSTKGVREKVLAKHRERAARGSPAILLGLESMAEGVDLPGAQCRVVIVTRLPFRPPSGPVEEEHDAWLRAQGKNYFSEVAMPDAFRRLVQRMGRLIRTEEDSGVIYVLDRRLVDTPYGRRMLNALPPYPVTVERRSR